MDFVNNDTRQIAKNLLGVKVIYQDTTQTITGYIVETEAYSRFESSCGSWLWR